MNVAIVIPTPPQPVTRSAAIDGGFHAANPHPGWSGVWVKWAILIMAVLTQHARSELKCVREFQRFAPWMERALPPRRS